MEDQENSLECYKMFHENLQDCAVLLKPKTTTLTSFGTLCKLVLRSVVTRNYSTIEINIDFTNSSLNIKDILSAAIACNQCVQVWHMLKDMMFNFVAHLVFSRYTMLRTCRIFLARVYANTLSWRRQNKLLVYSPRPRILCHDQKCDSFGNSIYPQAKGTLKRKRGKAEIRISRQDLEPLFSGSMMEAARYLRVSRSTIKRKCRQLGISQWPSCKGNKRLKNNPNQRSISSEQDISNKPKANQSSMSEEPSLELLPYRSQTKRDLNLLHPWYTTSVPKGNSFLNICNQSAAEAFMKNSRLCDSVSTQVKVAGEPTERITIKATYKEDMIRFNFPVKSSIVDLKKEVAVRLNLMMGTFKLKYWDDDDEWALLAWDSDWEDCIWISRSSQSRNNVIRVLVQDV